MRLERFDSTDQFNPICDSLLQFGKKDHEDIEFIRQPDGCYAPVTKSKPTTIFLIIIHWLRDSFTNYREQSALDTFEFIKLNQKMFVGKSKEIHNIGVALLNRIDPNKQNHAKEILDEIETSIIKREKEEEEKSKPKTNPVEEKKGTDAIPQEEEELAQAVAEDDDEDEVPEPSAQSPSDADVDFYLTNLVGSEVLLENKLRQIMVLSQLNDGTLYGPQNCGYHALKNALIALDIKERPVGKETLFEDEALFLIFYQTYCEPFLEGREADFRDADPTLIRRIIKYFKEDQNPPAELADLQKSLQASESSLAVLNMGESESGNPKFLVDEMGVGDALKLYDFAKSPGPASVELVFGNQATGHWYTFIATKDDSGELNMHVCDSYDNHHIFNGENSPVRKIFRVVTEMIKEPDKFIKDAFDDRLGPILRRQAGYIIPHTDEMDEVHLQLLIDPRPAVYTALDGIHDGSKLQIFMHQMTEMSKLMQHCGWFQSNEAPKKLYVDKFIQLASAVVAKLPNGDDKRKLGALIPEG